MNKLCHTQEAPDQACLSKHLRVNGLQWKVRQRLNS